MLAIAITLGLAIIAGTAWALCAASYDPDSEEEENEND